LEGTRLENNERFEKKAQNQAISPLLGIGKIIGQKNSLMNQLMI